MILYTCSGIPGYAFRYGIACTCNQPLLAPKWQTVTFESKKIDYKGRYFLVVFSEV